MGTAPTEPTCSPRWQRRSDARPGEILAAALDQFVERGFAATRMDEIAQRAGVTKGTLYLYFPSKEALFRAAVEDSIFPVLAEGERLVQEHVGPSAELFRQVMRRWWQTVGNSSLACLPKLMSGEAANFPALAEFYVNEVIHRGRRIFAAVLERGIERGEFRPLDIALAVRLAQAPLINAITYRFSLLPYDSEPWDFEAYIELHADTFLRGIAARDQNEEDE